MGPARATLTMPNRIESVRPATAFLVQTARALEVPHSTEPIFEVAVSEAIANAVRHGRGGADATITCDLEVAERRFTLRIVDSGGGFAMSSPQPPEVSRDPIEALPESGYGVPIMQSVFPIVRVVNIDGRYGVELGLNY